MSYPARCILLIALLLLAAFFAMSECAFSYCNQIKLKVEADDGKKSAKLALKFTENFDKYIITNLICSNIVILLFSVLSTVLFVSIFTDANFSNADSLGALISTIASTLVVFLFGEIIPKGIGKTFPNKICKICAYPIWFFDIILTPISLIFRGIVALIKLIFKTKEDEPLVNEEDLKDIVENIEASGLIEEQESDIIQSAIDFDDAKVKQVMCPLEKIVALDIDSNLNSDQLIDFLLDNNYTRIPVYKHDLNHIIGILHTQKLLKEILTTGNYDIEKLLVEPVIVTLNVHLDTLVEEFKKKHTHMAVVVDKDDNTLGIVTMEDALEELVGDIDESKEGD